MTTATPPDKTEAAEYYFTYINQVPAGDIRQILEEQGGETLALLRGISEDRSLHRYAADKWSIREVAGHINDTERLFVFRAFWFARGFDTPLPIRTSRSGRPVQTRDRCGVTLKNSRRSALRRCPSSGTCRRTRGYDAAWPAATRSPFVRSPMSERGTLPTT